VAQEEGHNMRDYVLFKRMSFKSKDSRMLMQKRDRSLRVLRNVFHVLYDKEFISSLVIMIKVGLIHMHV
jgi:hypothetical protein